MFSSVDTEADVDDLRPGTHDCGDCHITDSPTPGSAALKSCDRPQPNARGTETPPDFFIIGGISEIYVPVVFPHKLHAAMTDMTEGCSVCHHKNPKGPTLQCKECHGGPSNPVNLEQPSLKGAYHRQCL